MLPEDFGVVMTEQFPGLWSPCVDKRPVPSMWVYLWLSVNIWEPWFSQSISSSFSLEGSPYPGHNPSSRIRLPLGVEKVNRKKSTEHGIRPRYPLEMRRGK